MCRPDWLLKDTSNIVFVASALIAHLLFLPSLHLFVGLNTYILLDSLPLDSPRDLFFPSLSLFLLPPRNSSLPLRLSFPLPRPLIPLFIPPFIPLHLFYFPFSLSLSLPPLHLCLYFLHLFILLLYPSFSHLLSPFSFLPRPPLTLSLSLLPILPFLYHYRITIAFSLFFLLHSPSTLSACSFWLTTNQSHLHLPVLFPSPLSLLFFPAASLIFSSSIPSLAIASLFYLLALCIFLQSFFNDSVLSWYQRVHVARALASPDLTYARVKVFLHDRRVYTVAAHLLSMLLLGLSQLLVNLLLVCHF